MLWTFKNSTWEQDNASKSFKVKTLLDRKLDAEPIVSIDRLIDVSKHPETSEICSKSLYPSDFIHCPFCGEKLIMAGQEESATWLAPYGAANGLKIVQSELYESISNKIKRKGILFPVPPTHGRLSFCSLKLGCQNRVLCAIQKENGQIWIHRDNAKNDWIAINRKIGASTLPNWSWASATDTFESGICLPTDDGPIWIAFDFFSGNVITEKADGASIGAPIKLGKYILAPLMRSGTVCLAYRTEDNSSWAYCKENYDFSESVKQNLTRNSDQEPFLGIPFIDELRNIVYWSCRGGYIKAWVDDSTDIINHEFKKWEKDEIYPATALIELGPPYKETSLTKSGFWQLCQDYDPEMKGGIFYKEIKVDGSETEHLQESEDDLLGQFITTGNALFTWSYDYWIGVNRSYNLMQEQKEIRFPLFQFGQNGMVLIAKSVPLDGFDESGSLFSDLFYNKKRVQSAFVRFVLQTHGLPEKKLYLDHGEALSDEKIKIVLSNQPEISSFIHKSSLYIYIPDLGACFCWR